MANIRVILACHHNIVIPHTSKEDAYYCRMHGIQPVAERWLHEWKAVCLTCTWARWCGNFGELEAAREARRHVYFKHEHDVITLRDSRVKPKTRKMLQALRAREIGDTLDLFDSTNRPEPLPPPF